MQALAGLAIATLVIVSFAVGSRLVGVYRRTRHLPELLLGLMLLLCAGLGYPLRIAAAHVDPAAAGPLAAAGSLALAFGITCLIAFTGRVFRPESRWGRAAVTLGSAAVLTAAVWDALDALLGSEPYRAGSFGLQHEIVGAVVMFAYVWSASESLRYRAILTRRLRLGLADPVVSNRMLLWGLMCVADAASLVLNGVAALRGVDYMESPVVLLGSSAAGLFQAVVLVLAFMPPRTYLAWVRGSHAGAPA